MTNFYISVAEQNIFRTLSFGTQSRNNSCPRIGKSLSFYEVFKNSLLKCIRSSHNRWFTISESLGINLLTRYRLVLSHLREHKFNHNFQDIINSLCCCSLESESTTNFFSELPNLQGFL